MPYMHMLLPKHYVPQVVDAVKAHMRALGALPTDELVRALPGEVRATRGPVSAPEGMQYVIMDLAFATTVDSSALAVLVEVRLNLFINEFQITAFASVRTLES